ncbi:MAG TPA: hypothetical protein VMS17_13675 [Gemmataceae bacterium]|nr:hypothetical protein [Gemmataceae bacterium]
MENCVSAYGALVKVRLSNPNPRPFLLGDGVRALPGTVEVDALVSTGAFMTSIHPVLIGFPLGLPRVRETPSRLAVRGATAKVTTYAVDLEVEGIRFAALEVTDGCGGRDFVQARGLLEADEGGPPVFHVILGRDVLGHARLVYEGARGAFDLVFP